MNYKNRIPAWEQNNPKHINPAKRWWASLTRNRQALLVMRYLTGEAMARKAGTETDSMDWAIIEPSNQEIYEALRKNRKTQAEVPWKNFSSAKRGIQRSLAVLESVGLIETAVLPGRGGRLVAVYGALSEAEMTERKGDIRVTLGRHKGDNRATLGRHKGDNRATIGRHKGDKTPDSTATNKAKIERNIREYNVIEYKEERVSDDESKTILVSPQVENQIEDVPLAEPVYYSHIVGSKKRLQNYEMSRAEEPKLWPEEYIQRLENYINHLTEHWGYMGGFDNDEIKLSTWINNPTHTQLVAPWLHPQIHYNDLRDVNLASQPETFKKYGFNPLGSVEGLNRILVPGKPKYEKLAETIYAIYAQPFNNPYLSPAKKGLAFIRQFPFGYNTRDWYLHPWSPPLIPWAVVADNKELLDKWNKKYWHSGFHPFAPDATFEKLKLAITTGNREVPEDPFFDTERYNGITGAMQPFAGARSIIVANPGPFQLLYWLCGTIGVSPTSMLEAFKQARAYRGAFKGLSLDDPSNAEADKIRIFACWLKQFAWGDSKGSWLPREQGAEKSLASGVGQEWSHQGVLGGTSVLVRCHDGQMREAWLTTYQKAIYDLKFNANSEQDKEVLDSLLAELL